MAIKDKVKPPKPQQDKRPKKLKDWKSVVLVTCPRKGHIIGELKTDEKHPTTGFHRKMTFREGQQRLAGEKPCCAMCNSQYEVDGNVHTSIGWYPEDPVLEPVPLTRK